MILQIYQSEHILKKKGMSAFSRKGQFVSNSVNRKRECAVKKVKLYVNYLKKMYNGQWS